jgi:hypothetical protein
MPVVIGSWFIVSAALGIAERFASSLRAAVAGDKQEGRGRRGERVEGRGALLGRRSVGFLDVY